MIAAGKREGGLWAHGSRVYDRDVMEEVRFLLLGDAGVPTHLADKVDGHLAAESQSLHPGHHRRHLRLVEAPFRRLQSRAAVVAHLLHRPRLFRGVHDLQRVMKPHSKDKVPQPRVLPDGKRFQFVLCIGGKERMW